MLSPLQKRLAELFFALDEAAGFALAGGAALIVRGEIDRETHDLDFFADPQRVADITTVVTAMVTACAHAALVVVPIQSSSTFARLEVSDPATGEVTLIDVALDAIDEPPTVTDAGPTLTAKELGANKLLALYGRMEARDFEDTWKLARRLDIGDLLRWAADKDDGFVATMFAESVSWLDRHPNRRFTLPDDEIREMRIWFAQLRETLLADGFPRDKPVPR